VRLKVVADDAKSDLTVLQIVGEASRGPYPYLRFGSSDALTYGSIVSLVGFPIAGSATTTVTRAGVVGMDERDGWIKVDGGMMHGVSGGAAVDERGDLIGIPTMVQADHHVPFFGDDDMPQGSLTLGTVGFVRSVEALRRFLSANAATQPLVPAPPQAGLSVSGTVVEKGTGRPVAGATIGLLVKNAAEPQTYISRVELLAYARSGSGGAFALNRLMSPGTYLIKVVHPDFKTLISELTVNPGNTEFDVEVVRE
jgi:S1-C subfamily serine protease